MPEVRDVLRTWMGPEGAESKAKPSPGAFSIALLPPPLSSFLLSGMKMQSIAGAP
jgi:hypothetical protein